MDSWRNVIISGENLMYFAIFAEIREGMEQFIRFFAFPLNLIFALLWLTSCLIAWRTRSKSAPVAFILSPFSVILSIVLFLGSCLWIGCSGDRGFVRTLFFILVFLYFQTVLLFVVFRGWKTRSGRMRVRFTLNHAGLLLALGAAFWGNPDNEELRMKLYVGETSDVAYRMDGGKTWLDKEIKLERIRTDIYEDGSPMQHSASLLIGDKPVEISVNHPYSSGMSENIYLASMGDGNCVLQIVREPWRYFALSGIIMMITGAFLMFIKGPKS